MKIFSKITIALVLFVGLVFVVGDVIADSVNVSVGASPTSGNTTLNVSANGNISVSGVSCANYRIHCWTGQNDPIGCRSGGVSKTCTYSSAGTYNLNLKAWLPNDSCSPPRNYCGLDVDSVTISVSDPSPPPPANSYLPEGALEVATCDEITGWAYDRDNLGRPIYVHLYVDGAYQPPQILANINRVDVGDHVFNFAVPDSLKDGTDKVIRVYGINIRADGVVTGTNVELLGSPKTINCEPPPFNDAEYVSSDIPSGVNIDETFPVSVTFKNVGTTIWTVTDMHRMGIHEWDSIASASAHVFSLPSFRFLLTEDVAPQESFTFTFDATAPATPGTYSFPGFQMLQEGLEWFGEEAPSYQIVVAAIEQPTVDLDSLREPEDYCTSPFGITVNWTYSHPTEPQMYYRIQIDDEPDFLEPIIIDTGMQESSTNSKFVASGYNPAYLDDGGNLSYGATTHYVRVKVRIIDRHPGGIISDWSNVMSWTTPNAPVSHPNFTWEPEQIVEGGEIQFTDTSADPKPLTYAWSFGDGGVSDEVNPTYTYETDGNKSVTLTANPGGETECSITKDLDVKEKPPIWKEILPNLFFSAPSPGLEPGSSGPKPDVLSIILQGLFKK